MEEITPNIKFEQMVHGVLEALSPGQWGTVFPGSSSWSASGVVFVYGQSTGGVRVGILSELELTPELVNAVAKINATMVNGALWLVEGEPGNWQLIWGAKMPWSFFQSDDFMAEYVGSVAQGAPLVRQKFMKSFGEKFGGRPWWRDDAGLAAQGMVLATVSS